MDRALTERIVCGLLILACFTVLAWLNGRYVVVGAGQVALYTILGLLVIAACLAGLAGLVLAVHPPLRRGPGYVGGLDAVARGYLIAIPFTALALLADLAFGWNAATAFIQATIMTSGAAVGAELMRSSGQQMRLMVIPMAGSFVFSGIWIAYSAIFSKAVA
ncbi:MAG: hypothetical protein H5T73_01410 [Actinobacteria bacterium]|nr:hypothetical protein [Actinomycetota bacterium]